MPKYLTVVVPFSVAGGPARVEGDGGTAGWAGAGSDGTEDRLFAVLAFDGIDRLVEADGFLGVLIEFDLIVAGNEAG